MDYENSKSSSHQLMSPWTQVLLSVSVFSFIYLYSQHPSWCSFLLHSLKFYLSAIPFHALDKRWIFLICNGILVVLANTSGLVCSPSSGFDLNDMIQNKIGDHHSLHTPPNMKDESLSEGEVLLPETAEQSGNAVSEEEGQEIENDEETKEEEEEGGGGDNLSFLEEDHDHEEQESGGEYEAEAEEIRTYILDDDHEEQKPGCGFLKLKESGEGEPEAEEIPTYNYILEDDNQVNETYSSDTDFLWEEKVIVEDEQMEKLSTEELNKKFEDFIRKMKEELRIEAQQQLVVVK